MTEESHVKPPARTSPQTPARRFGDEEIRRILQSAAELQERSSPGPGAVGRSITPEGIVLDLGLRDVLLAGLTGDPATLDLIFV